MFTRRDPADQLRIEQAVFLKETGDIIVDAGDMGRLLDANAKRLGPVMSGQRFIALAKPFAKEMDCSLCSPLNALAGHAQG